jgi:hypothetical protein
VLGTAACFALLVSGCRFSNVSFREDKRVEIVAPENRDTVRLPFEVRWTTKDFQITGADGEERDDAGYFAVLLDRSPMPPGEDLTYFARDDDTCRAPCPDLRYLADRNIHVTQATTFRVDALADTRPVDRPSADDDHEITIILLNGKNERIGESAYRVSVLVDRGQGS